ncbi:opacity protein-like surface antigen [Bradyrhizobium sp. GM6.1]
MKKFLLAVAAVVLSSASVQAADLAAHYTKAPMMATAYSWTGFYVGGNVGGQWGSADPATSTAFYPAGYFADTSVTAIAAVGAQRVNSSSVTGGLTAGYNWQLNNAVLGLEGDINYFGLKGSASGSALYPCCAPTGFTVSSQVSADWLATIRGRIGFLAAPTWLLYAHRRCGDRRGEGQFQLRGHVRCGDGVGRVPRHTPRLDRRCRHRICLRRRLVAQGGISLRRPRTQHRDQHQSAWRRVSDQRLHPLGRSQIEHRARRREL